MTSVADQFEFKIKHGELPSPIPRWRVQFKYVILWVVFAVFVIMGVMSAGVALWFIFDPGDLLFEYKNNELLSKILDILPLFWILMSLLMTYVAVLIFARAPRGYKYRTVVTGGVLLLAVMALGGAISATSVSENIEAMVARMPGYDFFLRPRINRIIKVNQNGIIGIIQEQANGQIFLRDSGDVIWAIDMSTCEQGFVDFTKEQTCVRAFGIPSTTINVFKAERIMPCPRGIRMQYIQHAMENHLKE